MATNKHDEACLARRSEPNMQYICTCNLTDEQVKEHVDYFEGVASSVIELDLRGIIEERIGRAMDEAAEGKKGGWCKWEPIGIEGHATLLLEELQKTHDIRRKT